jgi:hypothetical protein
MIHYQSAWPAQERAVPISASAADTITSRRHRRREHHDTR